MKNQLTIEKAVLCGVIALGVAIIIFAYHRSMSGDPSEIHGTIRVATAANSDECISTQAAGSIKSGTSIYVIDKGRRVAEGQLTASGNRGDGWCALDFSIDEVPSMSRLTVQFGAITVEVSEDEARWGLELTA